MSGPLILRIQHVREARLCMSGARQWFARKGWSWSEFINEGRPVQDFIDDGCPLAQCAVAVALREADNGR